LEKKGWQLKLVCFGEREISVCIEGEKGVAAAKEGEGKGVPSGEEPADHQSTGESEREKNNSPLRGNPSGGARINREKEEVSKSNGKKKGWGGRGGGRTDSHKKGRCNGGGPG